MVFIDFQVRILVPLPDIGEWRNWQTQRVQKQKSCRYARVVELADTRDLKSLGAISVPVRVRPRAPIEGSLG